MPRSYVRVHVRSQLGRLAGACGALAVLGCLLGTAPALATPTAVISRFAGTGTTGATTAGPALSTDLETPVAVAVNPSNGDVYIADNNDFVVDKVTPAGTLSIFAGTGTAGNPTPGPATSSDLSDPDGIAVNAQGDVYISDQASGEVLRVTPAGMLSIVAGTGTQGLATPGPATSSHLDTPLGLALDANGDLYIADDAANQVYKVTPSGTLSIVAGNGTQGTPVAGPATSSPFDDADGVAVDANGDLYIANGGDGIVNEVTPAGTLSNFAGTGTYGNPTPGPATSSDLAEPDELAIDGAGNLYIADYNDIEEVSSGGTLSILAGNNTGAAPTYGGLAASSAIRYAAGVATTPAGRVYIADTYNSTVDLVASPAPVSSTPPTVAGTTTSGQTLTAGVGTWTNDPVIYTYAWEDCTAAGTGCVAISGATASTYTLTGSDVGQTIRVVVTAENGSGSAVATSAASALISTAPVPVAPVPTPSTPTVTPTTSTTTATTATTSASTTPTTAPTTTSAPSLAVNETTAGHSIHSLTAVLGGMVAANQGTVTYQFQYGSTSQYGKLTPSQSLGALSSPQTVTARIRRLIPGSVYHYRVMVTNSSGTVSYGADKTLTTPRTMPRRVHDHIYSFWAQHAPYHYRLHGWMALPHGISSRTACRTHGYATVTVTHGKNIMATRRVKLSASCTYDTSVSFSANQLKGSGQMSFHMHFLGNHQLRGRVALTLKVLYGPVRTV